MGRPKTITTDDNMNVQIHKIIMNNRRIKVKEMTKVMSMSKEGIRHVLNQDFSMRKLSTCWVLRLLTLSQKRVRLNISNALLAQLRRNKSEI